MGISADHALVRSLQSSFLESKAIKQSLAFGLEEGVSPYATISLDWLEGVVIASCPV